MSRVESPLAERLEQSFFGDYLDILKQYQGSLQASAPPASVSAHQAKNPLPEGCSRMLEAQVSIKRHFPSPNGNSRGSMIWKNHLCHSKLVSQKHSTD